MSRKTLKTSDQTLRTRFQSICSCSPCACLHTFVRARVRLANTPVTLFLLILNACCCCSLSFAYHRARLSVSNTKSPRCYFRLLCLLCLNTPTLCRSIFISLFALFAWRVLQSAAWSGWSKRQLWNWDAWSHQEATLHTRTVRLRLQFLAELFLGFQFACSFASLNSCQLSTCARCSVSRAVVWPRAIHASACFMNLTFQLVLLKFTTRMFAFRLCDVLAVGRWRS